MPKWIAFEATGKCNLNCVHCRSNADMDAEVGDFTTEETFRLIDDIASFAKPVFVLSGGEPLLREDIFEIAQYGTDKGLRMCLATNGVLLNDDFCKKIIESGIRIVSLSLDGSTKEVHDNFRNQAGAFDGTIRGAEYLKKHGIEFIINSSFTKRNQDDIPNVYTLAKKLGVTAWYLFMIVPTGRGGEIMDELISKEDYEKILEWHYHMEKQEHDILVRPTCAPHYYRIVRQQAKLEGDEYTHRTLKFSTGGAKGCICGQVICFIDNRGNVFPCSYFPLSAGNVKTQTFQDIWENSSLFHELRDYKRYSGDCGGCGYIKVCGGCRARAYAVTGDYLAEEPFCSYVPPARLKTKS